jgi:hypothetical protein
VWKKNLTSLLSSRREKPNLGKPNRAFDTEIELVGQAHVKSKNQVHWAGNRWHPLQAGQENDANTEHGAGTRLERGYKNQAREFPWLMGGKSTREETNRGTGPQAKNHETLRSRRSTVD